VTHFDAVDIFTDESLVEDPYPYFEHLRAQCPVAHLPARDRVVGVTGYDEAMAVYRDHETFSSISSGAGPFLPLPSEPEGDDVSALIEEQREGVRAWTGVIDLIMMDPPEHTTERAVLMRLLTPKRLRENEEFMWRHADTYLDEIVPRGECEFIAQYSRPFTYFVIADLLGVPEEVHDLFRRRLELDARMPGDVRGPEEESDDEPSAANPFEFLREWFASFLEDRRREPKRDVLTDIAVAKYPDGSTPPLDHITRTATFLFLAGTETSARLLATCLRYLAEYPDLQERLRVDRELIPNFVEEALRIESPVKTDSRTVRRTATLGGVELRAGTCVSMFLGAANRDPRHFEAPDEFRVDRPHAQAHLAFGRGIHSCPGGPLARAEARVTLNRVLDRMRDIRLSEEHHGPPDARRFAYAPTYVLRGLETLHLEFTAVDR
jgi:cytochrome P450